MTQPAGFKDTVPCARLGGVEAFRDAGRAAFEAAGLPDEKTEGWRTFDLDFLRRRGLAPCVPGGAVVLPDLAGLSFEAGRVVLVDGVYAPVLSDPPAGVTVEAMSTASARAPAWFRHHLGALAGAESSPFEALSAARLENGVVIHVGEGVIPDKPIHLVHILTAPEGVSTPRLLYTQAAGSSVMLLETVVATGPETVAVTLPVSEIFLDEGARLRHLIRQILPSTSHILATLKADVAARGSYAPFLVQAGGGQSRWDMDVRLAARLAEARVDGIYTGGEDVQQAMMVRLVHQAPETFSDQLCKGVLSAGRGIYHSLIHVADGADGTEGNQLHRGLILDRRGDVDCQPRLEIHAEDVKCAHGATIGELDMEQLFYLQSRGLSAEAARHLLVEAFLGEVIGRMDSRRMRMAANQALGRTGPEEVL